MLVSTLVVVGVVVTLSDLHGRSQVARNLQGLAAARHELAHTQKLLTAKEMVSTGAYNELESIESSTADNEAGVTQANASTAVADAGISFDGNSLPTLNTCLTGVFQVLDQIDVGQVSGAVTELTNLSTVCGAVSP